MHRNNKLSSYNHSCVRSSTNNTIISSRGTY